MPVQGKFIALVIRDYAATKFLYRAALSRFAPISKTSPFFFQHLTSILPTLAEIFPLCCKMFSSPSTFLLLSVKATDFINWLLKHLITINVSPVSGLSAKRFTVSEL